MRQRESKPQIRDSGFKVVVKDNGISRRCTGVVLAAYSS
jgi:hypothetical protein